MDTITVKDGTTIYYKDWGTGQPLFFHHGWPLTADDWDFHMMFFLARGYRVNAHDASRLAAAPPRPYTGNDSRHLRRRRQRARPQARPPRRHPHPATPPAAARSPATSRVTAKAASPSRCSIPSVMVKSDQNWRRPIEVFDQIRQGTGFNRPDFYWDLTLPFYGFNRPGAKISEPIRQNWWWRQEHRRHQAGYDCVKAFSETDFTEDLKAIDVPTFVACTAKDIKISPSPTPAPLSCS